MLLASLLLATPTQLTISERTLRVQPNVEFDLTARGRTGCIEWVSERNDVAEVLGQRCEGEEGLTGNKCCAGAASVARVRTIAPPASATTRWLTFVHANAVDGEPDGIFCEVNVAPLDQLRVVTTVRQGLHAHELQWLRLAAFDAVPPGAFAQSDLGNAFSRPALEALDVRWRFEPEGLLRTVRPNETRQELDSALEAAGERWERYHRLAVVAGSNEAARSLTVKVSAEVVGPGGRRVVSPAETLSIEPSYLSLVPPGRVALAPAMQVLYKLLTCARDGECEREPHDSVPDWRTDPPELASVRGGLTTGLEAGDVSVRLYQPLFNGSAALLVSPPAELVLSLLEPAGDASSADAADAAGCADDEDAARCAASAAARPPSLTTYAHARTQARTHARSHTHARTHRHAHTCNTANAHAHARACSTRTHTHAPPHS